MLSVLPLTKKPKASKSVYIQSSFIDKYLASSKCVNPLYVVVYLFVIRHLEESPRVSVSSIAAQLEISEANVLSALNHWALLGVLSFELEGGVAAISLNDEVAESVHEQPSPNKQDSVAEEKYSPMAVPCPTYTPEELEIYSERDEIRAMFESAQNQLGRLLNYSDMNQLFSFYDWLRLPTPVIDTLVEHCSESGHTNMSYIERVALDWAQRGIDTCEKAQDYIQLFNKEFREILKAFGIFGRNPVESEKEYMQEWLRVLNMPLDMVLWACDQAVLATGSVSFQYSDSIIKRWHAEGITSLEAAKAQSEEYKAGTKKTVKKSRSGTTKKEPPQPKGSNKYLNFKQRDYDFDQIKAMERERLRQEYLLQGDKRDDK